MKSIVAMFILSVVLCACSIQCSTEAPPPPIRLDRIIPAIDAGSDVDADVFEDLWNDDSGEDLVSEADPVTLVVVDQSFPFSN